MHFLFTNTKSGNIYSIGCMIINILEEWGVKVVNMDFA